MDFRGELGASEAKIWSPLHVWATPYFIFDTMYFSMEGDLLYPPPIDRRYYLELLAVPEDAKDPPPVGTLWEVPRQGVFTIALPVFRTDNGLLGYQFSFTVSPVVPEPASLGWFSLGIAGLWLRSRRIK
jgi:hypothetical protein